MCIIIMDGKRNVKNKNVLKTIVPKVSLIVSDFLFF